MIQDFYYLWLTFLLSFFPQLAQFYFSRYTVKPFVIDRKNFLFSATDKGADASALFMSVIETAKRNGLNVFGYLSYLMLVLPSWGKTPSEEQLDSIMPWSATLPETCHRTYHQIVENMAEVK